MEDVKKKIMLLILDGWGLGKDPKTDALKQGDTPFMDSLIENYPNATLVTYGNEVGLPVGQMGNSEVGHLNIGAGRIVFQELARINNEIANNTLKLNQQLQNAIAYAEKNNVSIHLMGLLSDGGVHSHINHLLALCDILEDSKVESINIHAFADGRDTAPNGGLQYVKTVLDHIKDKKADLASVIGRYYAMDRDKRWERVKKAFDLLVHGNGIYSSDVLDSIQEQYNAEITDEFLKGIICKPTGVIQEGDVVLFFNFRTDRPRQLTEVLTQNAYPEFGMDTLDLEFYTMTEYDSNFSNLHALFTKDNLKNTLGDVIAQQGLTQTRIAETEKYPHVTFFFNGGREEEFEGEHRIMIPSPKVATYDLQPEMSAREVTDAIIEDIKGRTPDFVCLNYANTDMVGHTGVWEAALIAANTVDTCLVDLVKIGLEHNYGMVIIADHGNSDCMSNPDGSPHTAHTTNPVPLIYVSNDKGTNVASGKLGDLAPSILSLMGITAPKEMTGNIILS